MGSDEGKTFLKKLSDTEDMELFNSEAVKILVMFYWKVYKKKIIRYLFIPFLVYMLLFTLQFTLLPPFYDDLNVSTTTELILTLPAIGVLPFVFYFFLYEMRQFYDQGLRYFSNAWNILDVTSVIANLIVTISSISVSKEESSN